MKKPSLHGGLRQADFKCIGKNGLGDPLNSYPHSMAWFRGGLYVGTTRSNLCMLQVSKIETGFKHWPVECPKSLYDQDMRAQIWRFDPVSGEWSMVFRSPFLDNVDEPLPRELGYRGMAVYKGTSDTQDALYVCTYAPARGRGASILRSTDGQNYEEVPLPPVFGTEIITLRLLITHKDKIYTSPGGRAGGRPNEAGHCVIYETDDPMSGHWKPVNEPGFGDPGNFGVFELIAWDNHLYAGTANLTGFQIWRTDGEGSPPYRWERIVTNGGYRGPLNQVVASLCVHNGMLYAGSGIQHGGIDRENRVGPAPPELIRIAPNGAWDLIVGRSRVTNDGDKYPLSGFAPGFGNLFAGYFWRMESYNGWLYLGTFDWSMMVRYVDMSTWPKPFRQAIRRVGVDDLIRFHAGADLYRSSDGENWLPVTTQGFDNPYNYGIRSFQSTPYGLAVGLVNPFAPNVAVCQDDTWSFEPNPRGGMEIWLGSRESSHA